MHTFNPTTQEVEANGSLRDRGRKEGRKERKRDGQRKYNKGRGGRWCHISMYLGCAQKNTLSNRIQPSCVAQTLGLQYLVKGVL